jgi:hypothetical protein
MAQTGFMLEDNGDVIPVVNGSGTTAITAGDIVYSDGSSADKLTGTAASARNAVGASDISVKSIVCANTGYRFVLGVAIDDIPADGKGAVATEGVFITAAKEAIVAGNCVQGYEGTANKIQVADNGTTASYEGFATKIGRALTGATTDGKYLIWKLSL